MGHGYITLSNKKLAIFSPTCYKQQQLLSYGISEGSHYFVVLSGGGLLNHNVTMVQCSAVDACQPSAQPYVAVQINQAD